MSGSMLSFHLGANVKVACWRTEKLFINFKVVSKEETQLWELVWGLSESRMEPMTFVLLQTELQLSREQRCGKSGGQSEFRGSSNNYRGTAHLSGKYLLPPTRVEVF